MRVSAAVFGVALVGVFASSSWASVRISNDPGGVIGAYMQRFESLRQSGQNVIIDGPCLSACTLVLGTIAPGHLCVTSRARLGFHTAWRFDEFGRRVVSADGTDLLMSNYPPQIRSWIQRHGGLSPNLIYLSGRELESMYPECREEDRSSVARQDAAPAHARPFGAAGRSENPFILDERSSKQPRACCWRKR